MSHQTLLDRICQHAPSLWGSGKVADYIPALQRVNPQQFGIALLMADGQLYTAGQARTGFSIQSISKVLSLMLALQRHGEQLWQRVGIEPSGTAFNSLVQLEYEQGKPRNPFINAGALVVVDALLARNAMPVHTMLTTVRRLAGNPSIIMDEAVSESEYQHRERNAAMAWLMKSYGNFHSDVDAALRAYFQFCALHMNCVELVRAFSFLMNQGVCMQSGQRILSARQTQQINALLLTSGLYDAAGDFAVRVGMPGKSGVGGGIVGAVPGKFTVCVWSPELNEYGNSVAGLYALEQLADELNSSIFRGLG
ncbi:glutaminase [Bacterioplanes sanyensis]|uniref:Glutaminase n=1 Tax=Bacterioplanes sanyensis TaxID=1249553 RepID=A0A222FMH9_9GAMM|nr:glutaminase B [Bacterioplanes sanyensis]ASP39796.1 glutaminase [Bacterioplanes sanyensis]